MSDKSIDVCLFNGAIRTEENEYMAKMLRAKSKVLVAFGSCAHQGSVIGLGNLWNRKTIFDRAYFEAPSTQNPNQTLPKTNTSVTEGKLTLPEFLNTVKTLDQTVDVDYYLPGCPPQHDWIVAAVEAIAKNELPPKGSVIGPSKSVCDE